jgi:hypothetical protein
MQPLTMQALHAHGSWPLVARLAHGWDSHVMIYGADSLGAENAWTAGLVLAQSELGLRSVIASPHDSPNGIMLEFEKMRLPVSVVVRDGTVSIRVSTQLLANGLLAGLQEASEFSGVCSYVTATAGLSRNGRGLGYCRTHHLSRYALQELNRWAGGPRDEADFDPRHVHWALHLENYMDSHIGRINCFEQQVRRMVFADWLMQQVEQFILLPTEIDPLEVAKW